MTCFKIPVQNVVRMPMRHVACGRNADVACGPNADVACALVVITGGEPSRYVIYGASGGQTHSLLTLLSCSTIARE